VETHREQRNDELAALKVNTKRQALMMLGSVEIPAEVMARTKGEAAAPPAVPVLTAVAKAGELESTIIPTTSTPQM
jgi:hypothetical protein